MGVLPEERRPDGPEKVRRRMTRAWAGAIRIFRYRGIKNPLRDRPCRCVTPPETEVAAGARGVGAWGRAPAKAGGWTRSAIATLRGVAGYYVIAEDESRLLSQNLWFGDF